ncbi:hypothetical protein [Rhizobium sp. A37_96]
MAALVNPADALPSFQQALEDGEIHVQKSLIDPEFYVVVDNPNGEIRLTYAMIEGGIATAIVIAFAVEPMDGKPCFQLGWAVPEHYRKHGRATKAVRLALLDLEAGLSKRKIIPTFYVEAVVGIENVASQKVAAATLTDAPTEGSDKFSGHAVLHYTKKVG